MKTELTQDEKRLLIAEACGWMPPPEEMGNRTLGGQKFMSSEVWRKAHLPRYFDSLDAIHEAEKALTEEQRREYWFSLADKVGAVSDERGHFDSLEGSLIVSATAAQRAESFGLACGLWSAPEQK